MSTGTDIAVIGAAGRFPDAPTVREFWANLAAGRVSTRELDPAAVPPGAPEIPAGHPDFVRVAATVADPDRFAAEFFGYPPGQAELIDPAYRIFLEVCWEALESAAHPPTADGPLIGVFAGGGPSPYSTLWQAELVATGGLAAVDDLGVTLGGSVDFLASRVAYQLGLRGPSVVVQTACSSSLTAVHYAVLSLLSGECDLALAGGTSSAEPLAGYRYTPGGIMARDGICRPFDAAATGTGAGCGTGVVVLRRLADALADADHILAVVRGSAVGNDGHERAGFTAPSPHGVADVVATALSTARVHPREIRYLEAHGSGTALGDRIELRGLSDGFRAAAREVLPAGYCALGSVKANLGHAGWAAGIAGFLKAVRIAGTGQLPPHPTFAHPRDPGVLAESPFVIQTRAGELPPGEAAHVLVNSMGLGGANAAVVVSPPPPPATRPTAPEQPERPFQLLLSARTRAELDQLSRNLAEVIEAGELAVADVTHTLRVGRTAFRERRVVTAPAGRLAAALRMPRPPAARTVRTEPLRLVLVAPEGEPPPGLTAVLVAGLGDRPPVLPAVPEPPPAGAFLLVLASGAAGREPPAGPDRTWLWLDPAGEPGPAGLEQAMVEAWLAGVPVRFGGLPAPRPGHRVPLPTYPFRRTRHWVLDRLHRADPPPAPATVDSSDGDPVMATVTGIWEELFGTAAIGPDQEFGQLGGTSLLSVKLALEIQQRLGVLINLHRAGGRRTTIRRLAGMVQAARPGADPEAAAADPVADGDGSLIDQDLAVPLGPLGPAGGTGPDVLLTGATGFVGGFLLQQLLRTTGARVHCLVRADHEAGAPYRLTAAAKRYGLPEPDLDRVSVVVGDLRDAGRLLDGELAGRIGQVVHCAARVVFTEPYRVLREENVLAAVNLLSWMRRYGIGDLSYVSSLAATGPGLGGGVAETRDQPLDPEQGGYGVSKWVLERILERAERDGLRVRVFRPGLLLGATGTGGCNPRDMLWRLLAAGLAVGAHPMDDRGLQLAPVDVVARAIVELGRQPGSAGRAYHLVDERPVSVRGLFGQLAEVGLPTAGLPPDQWQQRVLDRARQTGSPVLASLALYEQHGHDFGGGEVVAAGWRDWCAERDLATGPTGELLRRSLAHLATVDAGFGELLPATATTGPGR